MEARSHSEATADFRETDARGAAVLREKPLAHAARAKRGAMNFMVEREAAITRDVLMERIARATSVEKRFKQCARARNF